MHTDMIGRIERHLRDEHGVKPPPPRRPAVDVDRADAALVAVLEHAVTQEGPKARRARRAACTCMTPRAAA